MLHGINPPLYGELNYPPPWVFTMKHILLLCQLKSILNYGMRFIRGQHTDNLLLDLPLRWAMAMTGSLCMHFEKHVLFVLYWIWIEGALLERWQLSLKVVSGWYDVWNCFQVNLHMETASSRTPNRVSHCTCYDLCVRFCTWCQRDWLSSARELPFRTDNA